MFEDLICERVERCKQGKSTFLIHEFEYSYFVVGDHQFYSGYSLLLFKRHVRELHELEEKEFLGLSKELLLATKAVAKTYSPWKINHLCLGNQEQHIHWHIMPRYTEDQYHRSFPMTDHIKKEIDIKKFSINNTEATAIAKKIRENLH